MDDVSKYVDLQKLYRKVIRMRMKDVVLKEIGIYLDPLIHACNREYVKVIKRPDYPNSYVVKLVDHFRSSRKMRYLGEFSWSVDYLEHSTQPALEVYIHVRSIDPDYLKSYRFIFPFVECVKVEKRKWFGNKYWINYDHILNPIWNHEELPRYIGFVLDSYQYK